MADQRIGAGVGEVGPGEQARATRNVLAVINRVIRVSELTVVAASGLLMVVAILIGTFVLYDLFLGNLSVRSFNSLEDLQASIEHVFAGVLLLLLGLELLKGLTAFFVGYRVQVEIIVVVALIAVARHIMLVDFAHVSAMDLIGIAALILALALSYALVRQPSPAEGGAG